MPLFQKKPFNPEPVPEGLRINDEVFYCESTKEVFKDYNKFFERVITCHSTVWTCEYTGKSGLTYTEAIESEQHCMTQLDALPKSVVKAILLLVHQSTFRVWDLLREDMYQYWRNRYTEGELVDVKVDQKWQKGPWTVKHVHRPDGDPFLRKPEQPNRLTDDFPPEADRYSYDLVWTSAPENPGSQGLVEKRQLSGAAIRRFNYSITKELLKLFLRVFCTKTSKGGDGFWAVQPNYVRQYGFKPIDLPGLDPDFYTSSPVNKSSLSKVSQRNSLPANSAGKKSSGTLDGWVKTSPSMDDRTPTTGSSATWDLEERRLQQNTEAEKRRELHARLRKFESAMLASLHAPIEDLNVEDRQPLPKPKRLPLIVDQKLLPDLLMVMEFLLTVGPAVGFNQVSSGSISLEKLQDALLEQNSEGYFYDLLKFFLQALIREEEDGNNSDEDAGFHPQGTGESFLTNGCSNIASPALYSWELSLKNIALDSFTVTEILRSYLLAGSSKKTSEGYLFICEFLKNHPGVLQLIQTRPVYCLGAEQRMHLLALLCNLLVSSSQVRDAIEESLTKGAYLRRTRRDIPLRLKELMDKQQVLEANRTQESLDASLGRTSTKTRSSGDSTEVMLEKIKKEISQESQLVHSRQEDLCKEIERVMTRRSISPIGQDRFHQLYWLLPGLDCLLVEAGSNSKAMDLDPGGEDTPRDTYFKALRSSEGVTDQLMDLVIQQYSLTPDIDILELVHRSFTLRTALQPLVTATITPSERTSLPSGSIRIYSTMEEIREFASALTKRGEREKKLRGFLEGEFLLGSLNSAWDGVLTVRKSNADLSLKNAQSTVDSAAMEFASPELFCEANLCNEILDFEERLYSGVLGSWKSSREEMRSRLECRIEYIQGGIDDSAWSEPPPPVSLQEFVEMLLQTKAAVEPKFLKNPMVQSVSKTTKTTPDSLSQTQWEASLRCCTSIPQLFVHLYILSASVAWDKSAQNARCRICRRRNDGENLLLCDGCDRGFHTYCHRPRVDQIPQGDWFCMDCGPRESHVRNRKPVAATDVCSGADNSDNENTNSVVSGTSHDDFCGTCRRKGDLLMCDTCHRSYHLKCCRPPLRSVPRGRWLCQVCTGVSGRVSNGNMGLDEGSSSQGVSDAEDESNESSSGRGASAIVADDNDDDHSRSDGENSDVCQCCRSGGTLILCDNCPRSYHLSCCDPPLSRIPKGAWKCDHCRKRSTSKENESRPGRSYKRPPPIRNAPTPKKQRRASSPESKPVCYEDFTRLQRKQCTQLLQDLFSHSDADLFISPVILDDSADEVGGGHRGRQSSSRPLDLTTLRQVFNRGEHLTLGAFMLDLEQIFVLAEEYYGHRSTEGRAAKRLYNFLVKRRQELHLA